MPSPKIFRQLLGCRLIKRRCLILTFVCAMNVWPTQAAVMKLSQDQAIKGTANSALLVANSAADLPNGNIQPATPANTPLPATQSLTPIPEISVLFPIIGLAVAISLTQLLRRRRISQQRSSSPNGR